MISESEMNRPVSPEQRAEYERLMNSKPESVVPPAWSSLKIGDQVAWVCLPEKGSCASSSIKASTGKIIAEDPERVTIWVGVLSEPVVIDRRRVFSSVGALWEFIGKVLDSR